MGRAEGRTGKGSREGISLQAQTNSSASHVLFKASTCQGSEYPPSSWWAASNVLEVSATSLPLFLPSILVFPRLCQETTWKDLISRVGVVVLGVPRPKQQCPGEQLSYA